MDLNQISSTNVRAAVTPVRTPDLNTYMNIDGMQKADPDVESRNVSPALFHTPSMPVSIMRKFARYAITFASYTIQLYLYRRSPSDKSFTMHHNSSGGFSTLTATNQIKLKLLKK